MTQGLPVAVELPPNQVEEMIRSLVKGFRAFQMYLPNNPMYQRAEQNVRAAFQPVWASGIDKLVLTVMETDLVWDEQVVYHQPAKGESFAWFLFKDGMRVLTLFPGVEATEIIRFLDVLHTARGLANDAGEDLMTLLWAQEFQLVQYHFAEFTGDASGLSPSDRHGGTTGVDNAPPPTPEETRGKVAEEAERLERGALFDGDRRGRRDLGLGGARIGDRRGAARRGPGGRKRP